MKENFSVILTFADSRRVLMIIIMITRNNNMKLIIDKTMIRNKIIIIEYQVRPHQCEGGSWWQSWEFQSVAARSAGGSNNNNNNNNNNNSGQNNNNNNNNRINSLDNFPDISVVVASFGGLVKIPAWLEASNKRFNPWYFFF